jgi:hypothetical protein
LQNVVKLSSVPANRLSAVMIWRRFGAYLTDPARDQPGKPWLF